MVHWTIPYGEKTHFTEETKYRMEHDPRFRESKEKMKNSWQFAYAASETSDIAPEEWRIIQQTVVPLYETVVSFSKKDFP